MRRAVLATAIGNATEWYDYGVYSYLAVTIGLVFYPGGSQATQLIATFTTFAAAFLIRPIGGLILGPLGDRVGRRQVLVVTMLMMAGATFAIGLIPSAATIGIFAPILLLLARLVQGFSTGGEYAGAATFIAEFAPDRRRGFFGSWLEFGTVAGYITGAGLVTIFTLLLTPEQMIDWGWRIPFLLALPLGAIGLYLRFTLGETPVFEESKGGFKRGEDGGVGGQFKATFADQWRAILLCIGLVMAWNVVNYTMTAYLPSYLDAVLGYTSALGTLLVVIALTVTLVTVTLFGRLSDRFGRRRVLMSGCLGSIVLAVPSFWLIQQGHIVTVLAGVVILSLILAHFSGAGPSTVPAFFPTAVRYGALAISFNVSVAVFGGTTPLVAESLIDLTGNTYVPAFQVMLAGVVGLIVVLTMSETANRPLPGSQAMESTEGPGRITDPGQSTSKT
ncbi:MFS transporter [Spiractinospora alimapuensis]|uniref:MFS transporter n=1 Tax=Spiractinospora alimapuensis TaxID=2820884 RepID=UPI001F25B44E|nr:MFS transporter [Spiractinospora alimapuensis]